MMLIGIQEARACPSATVWITRSSSLPTGALLARLRRLRRCEESRGQSDFSDDEIGSAAGAILFKADTTWRAAYADLIEVLAGLPLREQQTAHQTQQVVNF